MKKSKVTIEPANIKHAKEFYGDQYTKSFKGYVALLDGKVVGIGGISFSKNNMMLFSDIKDELRPYKRDIVKGVYILKDMVEKINYPVVAIASKEERLSEKLLDRLGFSPSGYSDSDGSKIFWRFP